MRDWITVFQGFGGGQCLQAVRHTISTFIGMIRAQEMVGLSTVMTTSERLNVLFM